MTAGSGAPERVPRSINVVASTAGNPRAVGERIRETVRQLDATATVDVALLSDRVRLAMAPAAGSASGLGISGLLALSLTVLGLFGAVAQTVSARTFEIGVRRALGAPDWRVAGLVLSETAVLVGWGLMAGIAAALAVSSPLQSLLYDVPVADPLALRARAGRVVGGVRPGDLRPNLAGPADLRGYRAARGIARHSQLPRWSRWEFYRAVPCRARSQVTVVVCVPVPARPVPVLTSLFDPRTWFGSSVVPSIHGRGAPMTSC
jgi:hypothetical protein